MPKRTNAVRILPQRLLDDESTPPQEPTEAPPRPEQIESLLVIGPSKAGKSTLVQKFLVHDSTLPLDTSNKKKNKSKKWGVQYHKKDIVFCNHNDNSLKSMRVQVWDTSGITPKTAKLNKEWETVWKRASCVLLVLSLEDSKDDVLSQIQEWNQWLHQHNRNQTKPIVLVLHQSDRLQPCHPVEWMHFGKVITELCCSLQIQSWHITSSKEDGNNSVDAAFREILGRLNPERTVPSSVSTATTLPTLMVTPDKKEMDEVIRVVSPLT